MAVTDLTNTTWYVPAGWSATAGYGIFDILYYDTSSPDWSFQALAIGYDSTGYYTAPPEANSLLCLPVTDDHSLGIHYSPIGDVTFTITDGAWVKQDAYERQNGGWIQVSWVVELSLPVWNGTDLTGTT